MRAIVFDMDGVLLRSMHLHCEAWRRSAASLGLCVNRHMICRREGEPGAATARALTASPHLRRELLARKERYFARLKRHVRPYAGAAQLVRHARVSASLRLGLVTGTSRRELQAVLPARLLHAFHASVTGDEVRRGKPHPEAYRRMCRLLDCPPANVLVVENAPFGIQAARRARVGALVALATTVPRRHLRGADRAFRSLRLFDRWCRRRRVFSHPPAMTTLRNWLRA